MLDLHSLLHSLTSSEWQSLQSYFTCFSAQGEAGSKYLELAQMLMKEEVCPSEKQCCLKIYGAKKDHSFDMLKARLKDKILDFLATDICDKTKYIDEVDLAYIQIKKMSAQYQQLFYSKPRLGLTYKLVDDIIDLAKKYEYYFAAAEHLKLKRGLTSWQKSKLEFDKINVEIASYFLKSVLLVKTESYYQELIMLYDFSGKLNKKALLSFLTSAIADVSKGYNQTKSPIINYYLKYLEMAFATVHKNYSSARSICLDLLDVVRNNKSVYRKERIGAVYDNLSRCEFYLSRLEQAAEYAIEAQKHFIPNSVNYCTALEQEFYALFGMGRYEQSTLVVNKMLGSASQKELHEFRYSKYSILHANTVFMQNKFDEALEILSREQAISRDKAGWEIGVRLLKIMTLIEMLKLDEAVMAIKSLKEFFKYTDKKTPVSKRDKTILNLLLILERAGFMFSTLNGSTEKHLKALRSQDEATRWEPFTHELIPFHEWFAGKMRGKALPIVSKPLAQKKVIAQ